MPVADQGPEEGCVEVEAAGGVLAGRVEAVGEAEVGRCRPEHAAPGGLGGGVALVAVPAAAACGDEHRQDQPKRGPPACLPLLPICPSLWDGPARRPAEA